MPLSEKQAKTIVLPSRKVNWGTTTVFGLFHIGAIVALFMFSWKVFFATVFFYW